MASKAKVLVIGGSSGMGKAAAAACIAAGYEVTIAGRSKEKLAAAAAVIGGGVSSVELDVTDLSATEAFFAAIPAGTYKHLVVTMGASVGGPSVLGAEGFAKLKQQMDAKFFAQMAAVSFGAPILADGGSITLVSGALSKRPGKGSTALAVANAALEAAVKGLANDLGPRLRVNCVSPGLVDTEIWDGMPPERKAGMLAGFGAAIPAGRAGRPEDIGSAILFTITNTWMTGTTLDLDGGAAVRP